MKTKLKIAITLTATINLICLLIIFFKIWDTQIDLTLGLEPRNFKKIPNILTAAFVHSDWKHLIVNCISFDTLAVILFVLYFRNAFKILIFNWILGYFLLWIIGRPAIHIGLSVEIYGLISFLFFAGIIEGKSQSIALSLAIIFLYGSAIWKMTPSFGADVSWEGHFSGFIAGFIASLIFVKPQKPSDNQKNKSIFWTYSEIPFDYDYTEKKKNFNFIL